MTATLTSTPVPVTPLDEIRSDVPPGTIDLGSGDGSIWLIFPPNFGQEARRFATRYYRTWVETPDRAWFADYRQTWKDVNGWGIQLAQYAGPGTQLHRLEHGIYPPPCPSVYYRSRRFAKACGRPLGHPGDCGPQDPDHEGRR